MADGVISQKEIIQTRANRFFRDFPGTFDEDEKKAILSYVKKEGVIVPSVVRQFLLEVGLLEEKDDIYEGFLNRVQEEYSLEGKHVLEVGGGIFPHLADKFVSSTNIASITVYDPRLSLYRKNKERMKLVRQKFTEDVDVSSYSLIVGLMPCEASEALITVASKNHIDYMVLLSNWMIDDNYGDESFYMNYEEYNNSLICTARNEAWIHGIDVQWDDNGLADYHANYPLIYTKKR